MVAIIDQDGLAFRIAQGNDGSWLRGNIIMMRHFWCQGVVH